jgi:hypothetical protein
MLILLIQVGRQDEESPILKIHERRWANASIVVSNMPPEKYNAC